MPLPTRRRLTLIVAAVALTPALVAAPPAVAADGDITSVRGLALGGGYSPYLFSGCGGVQVALEDATPSDAADYAITVGGTSTTGIFTATFDGTFTVTAVCPQGLQDGQVYDVVVTESGGSPSAAFAWRYDVVAMPTAASAPADEVEPGELVLPLTGDVEPGATVFVKAVANKGGTRTEAIENNVTEIDVPASYDAEADALVLQVPGSAAGRFLWVSMTADLQDHVTGGLRYDPIRVAGPRAYDASWIESVGTRQGRATVGRTVSLTAPRFTSTAAADATTVRYRWLSGGRVLPTTRRSLRVTQAMLGKALAVRVVFSAEGTTPLVRKVGFGTVRR